MTISGGTIGNTSGAAITLSTNNAQNWNGDFTFAGSNDLNLGSGAVTMSSSRTVTVASNNLTVGGAISGSGYSLTKAGAGTLILAGSDTYTGPTTVSGGTLQIGAGGAAGSINGTSAVTDNAVLAFSRSDSVTFSNAIGGSGNVATLGPGTLVLSAADTYSGGTTVGGGTLQLGNAAALGSTSGAATVSGGVLDLHGYSLGVGALSGAGTINNLSGSSTYTLTVGNGNASGTFSGAIQNTTGAIALTKTGTGTLALGGSDTYSGGTTLSAGQLNLNNASALGSGALTISGGTIGNTSGGAITLSTNNAQNWSGDFTFAGSNDLNLGSGAVTMSSSRTVTVASNNLTVGGAISGSGYSLTKAGAGTLILTGADTYTGPTTVSAGTLQIGAGGASGSINSTSAVTDNSVLAFSRSDSVTFSIPVGGSGNVAMLGPGTLVLSAADTYSGGTTVGGGTLQLGNAAALGSTSGSLARLQRRPRPARLQPRRRRTLRRGDHRQPFRSRHVYADRRQRQRQRHILGRHPEHDRHHRPDEDRHGHAGPRLARTPTAAARRSPPGNSTSTTPPPWAPGP